MDAVTDAVPHRDAAGASPGASGPAGSAGDLAAEPFGDLVAHAHETHVVVVGGGIAGLVAALECAKVGMPVTLVEASDRLGGTIASAELDGLRVDVGTTCWSTQGGTVRGLVDDLGLGERVVAPRTDATWITGLPKGAAAPAPTDSVLGIPANPWDEGVRRIIGWGGSWRAYLDRLRPPLTIGKQHNLGRLVRSRMGAAVHDRLVAPLTAGGFGVTPDEVDVVAAAPGLTTALTRTGSLGGAVADLRVDRARGASIESLDGGMLQLVDALTARLELLGVRIAVGERVVGLARDGARWRVDVERDGVGVPTTAAPEPADEPKHDARLSGSQSLDARAPGTPARDPRSHHASIVLLATGRDEALRLLDAAEETVSTPPPGAVGEARATSVREVVTLLVEAPELDSLPRGAQVYPLPGAGRASGLVHHTARWEWLARAAGSGRHVLGVAFDGATDAHPTRQLDDAHLFELARGEASTLLGVRLDSAAVRGAHRAAFELAPPASLLRHAEATAAVRARVDALPGLAAVGAWLAGSGLARVVADARSEADRARRSVLWGAGAEE